MLWYMIWYWGCYSLEGGEDMLRCYFSGWVDFVLGWEELVLVGVILFDELILIWVFFV